MKSSYETKSDESLLVRIKKGDQKAFTHLVRRHTDRCYGLVWRLSSGIIDGEDVLQEAFLKLWQSPDKFDPDKGVKFTTWFYRVVSNLTLDHIRKAKKQRPVSEAIIDHIDIVNRAYNEAETGIIASEQQFALEEAIQSLPERQKMALTLCVYEDISQKDAAQIMDVNIKALESLLSRAKTGIKNELIKKNHIIKDGIHG